MAAASCEAAALGRETTEAGAATPGHDLRVRFQGADDFAVYDVGGESPGSMTVAGSGRGRRTT